MRRLLALGLLGVLLGAAFTGGYAARELRLVPQPWLEKAVAFAAQSSTLRRLLGREEPAPTPGFVPEEERQVMLTAIGYLSGSERAGAQSGVTRHDAQRAHAGLNLVNSGHAEQALLLDMQGRVLHRWHYDFRRAFPDKPHPEGGLREQNWRRVHLLRNGDLLAIYGHFGGLIKLDADSNLLWSNPLQHHHDLFVDADGTITTLTREIEVVPRIHTREPLLLDFVTVLDPEGRPRRRVSILEAFERSSYASLLRRSFEKGDLFHCNTVEVLDGAHAGRSTVFARGNVLISCREIDTVAVLDMRSELIVWAVTGQWHRQHQPVLLDDGHMLLFDNRGHRGMSKVIEFDPLTGEIIWAYEGDEANGFYSKAGGSNQRLANGNTLITQSNSGRAFEVTREGEIVWEFYNPGRVGEAGELVANLYEVIRLPVDYASAWLDVEGS